MHPTPWRKTTQPLMPARIEETAQAPDGCYNLYPTHELGAGQIKGGFDALAQRPRRQDVEVAIREMSALVFAALRRRDVVGLA